MRVRVTQGHLHWIVEAEAEAAGYMQLPLLCLTMASRALYRDTPAAGRCFSRHRVTCDVCRVTCDV